MTVVDTCNAVNSMVRPPRGRPARAGLFVLSAALAVTALLGTGGAVAQDATLPLTNGSDAGGPVPDNVLTQSTLFKLMMSEIAAQRGGAEASFATELKLAKETRDPRIARRATEFAVQARQPAQAVEAARLWTEISPASQIAADTYLTLLVLSGRFDDAEPLLAAKIEGAQSKSQHSSRCTAFWRRGRTAARPTR